LLNFEINKIKSMKIKFCGAAGTVTGSCHLLTLDSGFTLLLDCGLYQGHEDAFDEFNEKWLFDPKTIDCMLLSHAHIDHTGRIPKLVKDGFDGNIICTSATRDLCAVMLLDSASIQEKEAQYKNKRRKENQAITEPLYTSKDTEYALHQFVTIGYSRWLKINDEVSVKFEDAGHILGSASVVLKINTAQGEKLVGFSGDIGRPNRPILRDPRPIDSVDFLLCESTYGGKKHQGIPEDESQLLAIIQETCVQNKGRILIPAFSVGRTQELVYMLDQLETAGKLPKIKIFVDSPMAVDATEIFRMHPECYDAQILEYIRTDVNPFGFANLIFTRSKEDSMKLNTLQEPCIIIAASGMMNAGRIKHHIFNNIENPNTTLLVVGYSPPDSFGGRLISGAKEIHIFGETKQIKAKVIVMPSMSAHGDQDEMMEFLKLQEPQKLKKIFLVHGEIDRQTIFAEALNQKGFDVLIPKLGEEIALV
jgi:metallo-beta-lactamase family protein